MRRSLVLTEERSRHPFLASLPPHIRAGAVSLVATSKRAVSLGDLRDFLMAYCACFLAVSLYIA